MNLRGEVRESVSLDEDDLSDIEDEVFIRDGKRGYKFEDMSVKKPLMAPRRKVMKPSISSRIRAKPACKEICKPCCYAFISLATLIGLIALVIVLASLFPLPLDKLKNWIISKSLPQKVQTKPVQCNNLEVTEVWKVTFPKLTSETAVRIVDVNQDKIGDIIYGYSTGDDNQIPLDIFCPMFINTSKPCTGGVMALNGINGKVLWQHWLPGPVFDLVCTSDFDNDNIADCLVTGKSGIFRTISSKDGKLIWSFHDAYPFMPSKINVYLPSIIADQDNDNVSDIIAAQSIEKDEVSGYLLIISGKNGTLIQQATIPGGRVATYCKPQILENNGSYSILFGTGSLTGGGGLYIISLYDLFLGNMSAAQLLYKDNYKGILSPSVLVDITGDGYLDIVSAVFNSTIIAVNGRTLKMIWNYTLPNSETLSVPVPGYFNNDNVTDFLVKYQTGAGFPVYYYSQTFIIDGKTGKPIYTQPFIDTVGSQMGGLTIQSEGFGFDWFLYWTADCKGHEGSQDTFQFVNGPEDEEIEEKIRKQSQSDICLLRFNSSTVVNLFALSQFEQPPGFKIYDSQYDTSDFITLKDPITEAKQYIRAHDEFKNLPVNKAKKTDKTKDTFLKYRDGSSFRHKSNNQEASRKISGKDEKYAQRESGRDIPDMQSDFTSDYEQPSESWYLPNMLGDDLDADYNTYLGNSNGDNTFNNNKKLLNTMQNVNNRDPRSKMNNDKNDKVLEEQSHLEIDVVNNTEKQPKKAKHGKALKKNLSDKRYGIYDYQNVQSSQKRLMSDLNTLPSQILRDTYFKDQKQRLKKSRFEERDLKVHKNKDVDIDVENANSTNTSFTLWDLESENEMKEKEGSDYWRGKRDAGDIQGKVTRTTTVGSLLQPLNESSNGIDLILVTYWVPSIIETNVLLEEDLKCISENIKETINGNDKQPLIKSLESSVLRKCLRQRGITEGKQATANAAEDFPYYHEISQLHFGTLTVHRLHIECKCNSLRKNEKCVRFLEAKNQSWASYLGALENGVFKTRTY